jgi:hypothetical protein
VGSSGLTTTETRLTSRGHLGPEDGDDTEDTISPMKFTRRGSGGGRDYRGRDYVWDETSPGYGSRSAVESRGYFW